MNEEVKVPWFCKDCGKPWNSRRARIAHRNAAHNGVRPGPKPRAEPEPDSLSHYYWCKRNKRDDKLTQTDRNIFSAYLRDYRAKKGS